MCWSIPVNGDVIDTKLTPWSLVKGCTGWYASTSVSYSSSNSTFSGGVAWRTLPPAIDTDLKNQIIAI